MRTQKRFTPAVLERFERHGRGTGTRENYVAWHRVSRSDPASLGRSHIICQSGRQVDLLSDGEADLFRFVSMLPGLEDCREQFPLALRADVHELAAYDARACSKLHPGTLDIAREMGLKHPSLGAGADWRMSSDLLLVLRQPNKPLELLAISFKPKDALLHRRTRELQAIEQQYWERRKVSWLLITPCLYCEQVAMTLRRAAAWGLGAAVDEEDLEAAAVTARSLAGEALTYVLSHIAIQLGSRNDRHLRAFWQAVWRGLVPLDLRRGWRPHLPVALLTPNEFWQQNPVFCRRTAWN